MRFIYIVEKFQMAIRRNLDLLNNSCDNSVNQ